MTLPPRPLPPRRSRPPPSPLFRRLRAELGTAFVAAALVTLFINLGLLFVPLYDMILYDRVLQSQSMDTVTMLSVGCVLGMTLFGALEFCRSAMFIVMADRVARRLNLATLQAAMARSLEGDASAAAQAMRDLNELRLFVSGPAAPVPLDVLWSPALIAVLFLLHPAYGAFGLLSAGILLAISLLSDLATRQDLIEANAATAKSLNDLGTTLRNQELLDGLGLLPAVARRWKRGEARTLDALALANRRAKAFTAVARAARLAMQAGIVTVGVVLILRYEASPGSMMGANLLIAKLLAPFELLVTGWRQWSSALAAWERIRELLRGASLRPALPAPAAAAGRLAVHGLSFIPPGAARPVLAELSFSVEPGEAVAILGPSGAGKSTLARLLVGIFPPSSGEVLIDGLDVRAWDAEALGEHIGYLPQAVALLDGTILDNIARMREAETGLAVDAATRAGLHELIGRLPEGYATWIGTNGHALSGGQRQRLALARALYGTPRLLVLDEPNSNLDHVGEQALVAAVKEAKDGGAAVVLITHRPAVLTVVDRVILLEHGRIEGEGRSTDLLGTKAIPALAAADELASA